MRKCRSGRGWPETAQRSRQRATKKPPFGGLSGNPLPGEDAKVGLLVASFYFPRVGVFRALPRRQARVCSCIGLPGIAHLILFRVPQVRSHTASGRFRVVVAAGSAFCVHRPQYWRRLGPPFAGRSPARDSHGCEAFASQSNIRRPRRMPSRIFRRQGAVDRWTNREKDFGVLAQVDSKFSPRRRRATCANRSAAAGESVDWRSAAPGRPLSTVARRVSLPESQDWF